MESPLFEHFVPTPGAAADRPERPKMPPLRRPRTGNSGDLPGFSGPSRFPDLCQRQMNPVREKNWQTPALVALLSVEAVRRSPAGWFPTRNRPAARMPVLHHRRDRVERFDSVVLFGNNILDSPANFRSKIDGAGYKYGYFSL